VDGWWWVIRLRLVTCRDEVLAAFESLHRATHGVDFSPGDIVTEMRRHGSAYKDSTIRTHVTAHMVEDGTLIRSSPGRYRLRRHRDAVPRTTTEPQPTPRRPMRPRLLSAGPNGAAQLTAVLRAAGYRSTLDAVAAHTIMLNPTIVGQSAGRAIFRTVRRDTRLDEQVGSFGELNGQAVMFDDNRSPTVAFTWAAGHDTGVDMQFNHIWPASRDAASYTALWNLCATPAFLAKTTDGSNHPEVVAGLRRRAFDLYGITPDGHTVPEPPEGYTELRWAPFPKPVANLEQTYRLAMATKPKDRIVNSVRRLGWAFSGYTPDPNPLSR
jgi:hypothetical protein